MALTLNKNKDEVLKDIKNAIESGDSNSFAETIYQNIIRNNEEIQERLMNEAKSFNADNADVTILAQRGFKPLTAEETKYYNEVTQTQSFEGLQLPKTIFERVFEDLRKNHPLLSKIAFQNVTGTTEWVIRTDDVETAWWGTICEEIKKKLASSFKVVNASIFKVSAFVIVCKGMLDLGPIWIDRYVREILTESIADALEKAIIDGTGKDQPVGMTKKLEDVSAGTHRDKTPVKITDLTPTTIGEKILAPLSKDNTKLGKLLLIVNSETYYKTIYSFLHVQDKDGLYHEQKLPFEVDIIPSIHAPKDKMIIGEAKNYWVGIGSTLQIRHSDDNLFLEDNRVYVAKQYANGRPRKDEDFIVFDISGLKLIPAPGAAA